MQILIQPENKKRNIFKAATALSLLNRLELKPTQALVIRDNQLLTPDEKIFEKDDIIVRIVGSRG